jgi:hypothetical protein
MCRNIKILFNFDPPATEEEIRAASQFIGKVSGASKPSNVNQATYEKAIDEITSTVTDLLASLTTSARPKNRQVEADKARARASLRFGEATG